MAANPVEPDLALHQGFLEPSPEPSSEPCWTWPGFAPKPPGPSPEPSPEPCWTWPGSAPKPPRPSPEPSEPSPEPRWTSFGACTSAHRSYSELLVYAVGEKNYAELLEQSRGKYAVPKNDRRWNQHRSIFFGDGLLCYLWLQHTAANYNAVVPNSTIWQSHQNAIIIPSPVHIKQPQTKPWWI